MAASVPSTMSGDQLSEATVGQRRADEPDSEEWGFGTIVIRPSEYQVFVEGSRVPLTRREFEIFHCLARRLDRVVTRQEVYEQVWGGSMAHRDRSVDVFIRKVRQKLASVAPTTTFIHTHFGIGYRLAPERTSTSLDGPG